MNKNVEIHGTKKSAICTDLYPIVINSGEGEGRKSLLAKKPDLVEV